jgi:hypothetical protein
MDRHNLINSTYQARAELKSICGAGVTPAAGGMLEYSRI